MKLSRIAILLASMNTAQAAQPLWTLVPAQGFATNICIHTNEQAIIKYVVTNQSRVPHKLRMQPIDGVSTTGCEHTLRYKESCILQLSILGSKIKKKTIGGPVLCEQGNSLQCYQAGKSNRLVLTPTSSERQALLSASPTSFSLIEGGATQIITITNTGPTDAYNIHLSLTPEMGISVINNCPSTLAYTAPHNTCEFSVTSGSITGSDVFHITGNNTNMLTENITVTAGLTTLNAPETGIIPVTINTINPPDTGSVLVTNTGNHFAYNVHANLPQEWADVVQNADNCAALAPNQTCTLSFTSSTPYVAQGNIAITGVSVSAPATIALAFRYGGGLVFATENTPLPIAKVITETDISNLKWNSYDAFLNAYSITDGSNLAPLGNTYKIIAATGVLANIAAASCVNYTGDSSNEWYLPAICELGTYDPTHGGSDANCPAETANITTNLYQLGFLSNLSTNDYYWSSTEQPGSILKTVFIQKFYADRTSTPFGSNKTISRPARCARALSF